MFVGFGCVKWCIWVFRPCMVQQMLYIGIAPKGKILSIWHFSNIRILKPPYIRSLKIIGFLYFFNFWVRQKKITIYSLFWSPCIREVVLLSEGGLSLGRTFSRLSFLNSSLRETRTHRSDPRFATDRLWVYQFEEKIGAPKTTQPSTTPSPSTKFKSNFFWPRLMCKSLQ